ncbi:MAG: ATP-binding protein [Deltaproteobacteria bacterium]|nr:ATP-binding protein [Deltaproteobacteria bacterium]
MGRAEDIFEKVKSDGEAAIDEFILTRQSEELFLDFKRSADSGKGRRLHINDLNNLAKAISGFGNSEGGVIVWGVDASPDIDDADVAKARKPIYNVARFLSWLEGAVSGRTVPPHIGVQNHAIDIGSGNGFVATLIPKSERVPHQAIPKEKYYMRAGSTFKPVPHGVLAGMFGRRPQPILFEEYTSKAVKVTKAKGIRPDVIDVTLGFKIWNRGPVMARDLYSDVRVKMPGAGTVHFSNMDDGWISKKKLTEWLSMVSKDDFKLAPESFTMAFDLRVSVRPPFENGKLSLRWTFGCDGAPMRLIERENGSADVESLYREFLAGPQTEAEQKQFVCALFNLPSIDHRVEPRREPTASHSGPMGRKIRMKFQT